MVVPLIALVMLALTWGSEPGPALACIEAVFLIGSVLAAVHHAEVVAHRVGEPFGSLVLAAAVTIIELALIVELMASGGSDAATLARDTAFAPTCVSVRTRLAAENAAWKSLLRWGPVLPVSCAMR